jgi:UPF0716 protein FxsA
MRRRVPWWLLALVFVVVPVLEIYLLIQLGQVVGPWWTILILIADGIFGSWLMKREGSRAWRGLQQALASHRMPATELADGALILIGGTLLVTPGFISDVVGLFCVLPFTRPVARRALTRVITRKLATAATGRAGTTVPGMGRPGTGTPGTGPWTAQRPGHDDVVRGEVVDEG